MYINQTLRKNTSKNGIKYAIGLSNNQEAEIEDDKLIDRFLSGDEEGFEMLVKKYQNRVINIVHSLGSNIQNADDIAQEAFIKVYKNLASFNRKSKFSTWLYRITINTSYSYLRKEKRYTPLAYISKPDNLRKIPLEKLEYEEKQKLIDKVLKNLPFKYRAIIVLKEIEGLSYKDIAKTLGCRVGTVESRLFRARHILKDILSSIVEKEDIL